jgi:glutathione S-transferase
LILQQVRELNMTSSIKVSAFRWVPQFAQGLVRDLRVRWALEEAGLPYEQRLIGPEDQRSDSYRKLQPFGQVPSFEQDGVTMFESGAIVLHIAEQSEALMPADRNKRLRVTTWMFAALNSIEPRIQNLAEIDLFHADKEWAKQRRPEVVTAVQSRLKDLSKCLDEREYLEDGFTAADLLMTTVLRIPRHTDLVAQFANLEAYRVRCEARPAFKTALAAQMAAFAEHRPPQ